MEYTYKKLNTLRWRYRVYGTLLAIFFVFCVTSNGWMGFFYEPLSNVNVGITIALQDVTLVVDEQVKGKISNKEFYQNVNIVARKEIAETTPVILVIQDEKILATYILSDRSKMSLRLTFRPISEENIYLNYYQPPPMLAQKLAETGDYSMLTDYYVRQSMIDYRAFK
jgi:hypothetical protein